MKITEEKLSINIDSEKIESPYKNLAEFFAKTCEKNDDRLAILFGDKRYSYKELQERVAKFTKALQSKLGVKKGDKVVMLLGNSPDFAVTFFGILSAGAIAIPLITLLKTNEIIRIIKQSEVKAMIAADALSSTIRKIVKQELVPNIVCHGGKAIKGTIPFSELMETSDGNPEPVKIDENDVATINYTSGTTGFPKGVVHSHRNYLYTAVAQLKVTELARDGLVIMCLPMYHAYGLTVTSAALFNGSAIDILTRFNPVAVLEALCDKTKRYPPKYEITSTFVPAMIHMMLDVIENNPEYVDLIRNSKFDSAVVGAAPISRVDLDKWVEFFPDKLLVEGIASTEDCVYGAINPRDGPKYGSVGLPLPGNKLAIVDEEGNILPINTRGELVVQNEGLMLEYYKNPEKTKDALKPIKDNNIKTPGYEAGKNWYWMGDIAYMDEDGYFWIVDRKKDLVIVGGRNVFPRDIEELLVKHPKVNEACVIGEPDEMLGEVVKALIVPEKGVDITPEEIVSYCEENLADYMLPKQENITFLSILKKTATGKVLKKEYRASYEEIRAGKKQS